MEVGGWEALYRTRRLIYRTRKKWVSGVTDSVTGPGEGGIAQGCGVR